MAELVQTPHKPGEKYNLNVRVYGQSEAVYKLYDDDGETFDYEKGAYSWREIHATKGKDGKLKGTIIKAEKYKPDNIGTVTFQFISE